MERTEAMYGDRWIAIMRITEAVMCLYILYGRDSMVVILLCCYVVN